MSLKASLVCVAVAAMVLAGLGFAVYKYGDKGSDLPVVRVAINTWPGLGPYYVARAEGFDTEEGVRIEVVMIEDTVARNTALISGEADLVGITLDNVIIARSKGVAMIVVGESDFSNGGDGILANKDIAKVADLKGKRVACPEGLPSHFFLLYVLRKEKLGPKDITFVPADDGGQAGTLYASGKVDAAVTWDPWISQAEAMTKGKGHVIITTRDTPGLILGIVAAKDARGTKGLLIPVRVAEATLDDLHKTRIYIDFVGKGQVACLHELVHGIDPHEPTVAPEFPAGLPVAAAAEQAPGFPGLPLSRAEKSIQKAVEIAGKPPKIRITGSRCKVVNRPPDVAPEYFQDRQSAAKKVADFLKSESARMLTIEGRGGMGKTALACRLCTALAEESNPLPFFGVIYLGGNTRPVTFQNLFTDLCKLVPKRISLDLDRVAQGGLLKIEDKMGQLLRHLGEKRVLVLLDSFENMLNLESRTITDLEVKEALTALLTRPPHAVKVMLTTQFAAADLQHPERHRILYLDEGLTATDSVIVLRALDPGGKFRLGASQAKLLKERTGGNPRALHYLAAMERSRIEDFLADSEHQLPDEVMQILVGKRFSQLDKRTQQAMQALAVYGRPVPAGAVDHLLQDVLLPGERCKPYLDGLVNLWLATKDADLYSLNATDRAFAYQSIPEGHQGNADPLSRTALHFNAALFYKQVRQQSSREAQPNVDNLVQEFDHYVRSKHYKEADLALSERDLEYDQLINRGYSSMVVRMRTKLVGHLPDASWEARNQCTMGIAHYESAEPKEAIECNNKVLNYAEAAESSYWRIYGFLNRGLAHTDLGSFENAIDDYKQGIPLIAKIMDDATRLELEGNLIGNRGDAYRYLGDFDRAIADSKKAIEIHRKTGTSGFTRGQSIWESNLGAIFLALEQMDEAAGHYRQARNLAERLDDKVLRAGAFLGIGMVEHISGHLALAAKSYQQVIDWDLPKTSYTANIKNGILHMEQGNRQKAKAFLATGIEKCEMLLKKAPRFFDALYHLALAHLANGNLQDALQKHQEAIQVCSAGGVVKSALVDLQILGRTGVDIAGPIAMISSSLPRKQE